MKSHNKECDLELSEEEIAEVEKRKVAARLDKINYASVTGRDTRPSHSGRVLSTEPTPKQRLILQAAAYVVDKAGFVKYKDLRRELNGAIPDVAGLIHYMKKLGRWPYKTYGRDRKH
jgi:hypothetical protein